MNKLNKLILLSIGVFVLFGALNAQISSMYSFGQATANWEVFWGYYITEAMTDEGLSPQVEIGFTFPYCGNNFTVVKVSSNGWLNLGGNLNNPYYANSGTLATLNILPVIAPLWDDLDMSNGGAVMYNTFGAAPHRIFNVQWLAAKWTEGASNEFSFMVRLHETGQIDMIYGPHTGNPYQASASIGINMAPGGPGNYFSILPGLPAQAFTNVTNDNISFTHPSETLYLFAPRTTMQRDASALNLKGNLTPTQNISTELLATFGNAGIGFIAQDSCRGYLMRGNEVLSEISLPSMQPNGMATVSIPWTPDTTGAMQLYIKTVMSADTDTLNNTSYPININVQPYVGNDDQTIAPAVSMLSCYPNPFTTETTISYSLKTGSHVSMDIYNLKGQKIKNIIAANKSPGSYTAKWNGTDDKGKPVAKGIYLCKLTSDRGIASQKLILMK